MVTPFLPTACGTGVVGELNSTGALTFLTYLGGSSQDMVEAIGVDSSGNIWLTGVTLSMDFPYTADQYKINGFGMVPFLAEMSNSGTQLPFATELAGDTGESTDLQIDSANNIYVAGDGIQPPSTPGTYPPNPSAFGSAYLQKWNPGPEPVLAISPSVFVGFPDTPQGAASAPQVVTLQNTGGGAMTLSVQLQQNIVSTNATDFVVTTTCGATLAGNSSCTISMVFAPGPAICVKGPTCAPASRFAEILINDNAPQGMQYLELTGYSSVGAGMSAVPNPVVFPAQAAGTTSSTMQYLEVGSDGDTALMISNIVLGGANASDFTITTAGLGGNNCATSAIGPGSYCDVGLTFSPPATATGTRTATLTFTDNAGDSPQTVNITGTVAGASALTISPLTVSIGPVAIGTSTYGQVTLQNPSANSIQVTSLAVSGTNMGDFSPALAGCSSTTLPVTIAAGARCFVDVTFDPAAGASGLRTATLTLGTNPAVTGLPTVALVGDAVTNSQPGMTTNEVPNPMNFAGLQVGETSNNASVLFTIYNNVPIPCAGGAGTCGAPLIVNSITPGLSEYTLTGEGGVASPCTTFPASIPAFGYCTYVVVFKPVQAGSRNTTLTIASNDPQGPLQLPVYGTGLSLPLAELLNTELDFGNSAIGVASPPITTMLLNSGQAPLNISTMTPSANFAISANTCTGTLAPQATCSISITFTPPSAGYFTGALTITDNDAIGTQQSLTMTGTGATGPQLRIVPAVLNFGNQPINVASAAQTVTITSTGDTTVAFPANAVTSTADFILQGTTCGTSLPFGSSCTATVEFKPTTAQLPEMGTLLFSDNGNPQPIYMSGTGVEGTTASTTTLASSVNPAKAGQAVTFTATVKGPSGNTTVPTGTVTFLDGTAFTTLGTGTLNGSAQATYTTSTLSAGSHSITAGYGGDTNFSSSVSNVVPEVVNATTKAATTTAVASSANPAAVGAAVTFTATVAGPSGNTTVPTGTVTFMDGTTTLGTGTLNGSAQATYSTSALSAGSHSITAVYGGDANFSGSTSGVLAQVINAATLAATTTALTSSANPAAVGAAVTFTATVAGPSGNTTVPTGTVTFMDGTTTLGTGTLNGSAQATYSTSALSAGSHSITAVYGGDANFSGSTSSVLTQTIGTAGYSLSVNPTTLTVTAGQSGMTVVSVTPAFGFSQQVGFTCTGLPAASSCSFSPSTVTPSGSSASTTTLTVATDVSATALFRTDPRNHRGFGAGVQTFLAVVLIGLSGLVRTRRRVSSFFCAALLMVSLGAVIAGCGGGGGNHSSGGGGGGGATTPPGTSTVTVTGTAGTLSQTVTFTLTVQ